MSIEKSFMRKRGFPASSRKRQDVPVFHIPGEKPLTPKSWCLQIIKI